MATIQPFIIDSRDTLGRHLVGPTGAKLLWACLKSPWLKLPLWLSFLAGSFFSIAIVLGILPPRHTPACFLVLPALFVTASTLNVPVLRRLFTTSFDAWLLTGYSFVFIGAISTSLPDERSYIGVLGFFMYEFAIVSDAVPAKARKATTSLSFVTCLIATLSIMGAVYFDKIEGAQPWTVKFGAAETTSLTLSFNAGLNLVFFMLKVILQSLRFRNENRFALITSKVRSVKADQDDVETNQALVQKLSSKSIREKNTTEPPPKEEEP